MKKKHTMKQWGWMHHPLLLILSHSTCSHLFVCVLDALGVVGTSEVALMAVVVAVVIVVVVAVVVAVVVVVMVVVVVVPVIC